MAGVRARIHIEAAINGQSVRVGTITIDRLIVDGQARGQAKLVIDSEGSTGGQRKQLHVVPRVQRDGSHLVRVDDARQFAGCGIDRLSCRCHFDPLRDLTDHQAQVHAHASASHQIVPRFLHGFEAELLGKYGVHAHGQIAGHIVSVGIGCRRSFQFRLLVNDPDPHTSNDCTLRIGDRSRDSPKNALCHRCHSKDCP